MNRLFHLMLAGLLITALSACGTRIGTEQSDQSENAEAIEPAAGSQREEPAEPDGETKRAKEQEEQAMKEDSSEQRI